MSTQKCSLKLLRRMKPNRLERLNLLRATITLHFELVIFVYYIEILPPALCIQTHRCQGQVYTNTQSYRANYTNVICQKSLFFFSIILYFGRLLMSPTNYSIRLEFLNTFCESLCDLKFFFPIPLALRSNRSRLHNRTEARTIVFMIYMDHSHQHNHKSRETFSALKLCNLMFRDIQLKALNSHLSS